MHKSRLRVKVPHSTAPSACLQQYCNSATNAVLSAPVVSTPRAQMPDWLDVFAVFIHRVVFRWRCHWEAARLHQTKASPPMRLAQVLHATQSPARDAASKAWFARIEQVREEMQQDVAPLVFNDYGVPSRFIGTLDNTSQQVSRSVRSVVRSSAPPHQARLLFHLIREFKPQHCLELGTCLGISAAYQAAALHLNGSGHLVTLEGGKTLAQYARSNLERLGLSRTTIITGRFVDTLPNVLDLHGPFDYAFIDGHHDPEATLAYFRQLRPYLAHNALLVFDDIIWTPGMRAAWRTIRKDVQIRFAADLITAGICFFSA